MTEIQGKSILVRVSKGLSYWESTVIKVVVMAELDLRPIAGLVL